MPCVIRSARRNDLPLLARMNQHLIEDEESRNPMSLPQLEARLERWMSEGQEICLFEESGNPIGYCIYGVFPDNYLPQLSIAYIRHFFISRTHRKAGLGREALECLIESRLPTQCRITLDVLATNTGGAQFWAKLGFAPYSMSLLRLKGE